MRKRNTLRRNQPLGLPPVPVFMQALFSLFQCRQVFGIGRAKKSDLFGLDLSGFSAANIPQGLSRVVQLWLEANGHHAIEAVLPFAVGRLPPCLFFDLLRIDGLAAMDAGPDTPVNRSKVRVIVFWPFSLNDPVSLESDLALFGPALQARSALPTACRTPCSASRYLKVAPRHRSSDR